MFIYAALTNFGRVAILNVRMNVFVGVMTPFLFVDMCFTLVTPWPLKASKTSASSQSRKSRLRMTPLEKFRVRCGVTVIGVSIHIFMFSAFFSWCFVRTSTRMEPFASFLALATSPTALFNNFCIAKILCLIGSELLADITKNFENDVSISASADSVKISFAFLFFVCSLGASVCVFVASIVIFRYSSFSDPTVTVRSKRGGQRRGLSPGA